MPPMLTLIIALPIFIAVVVLFGALSLVGLIDLSDPALRPMGTAPARRSVRRPVRRRRPGPVPAGCHCLDPLQFHLAGAPRPAATPRAPCAAQNHRILPVGRLAARR